MTTANVSAARVSRHRWATIVAWAACGWAIIFAALSFFWAAGGRTELQPLEQAGNASGGLWIAANIIAGLLKLAIGLVALAAVGAWSPRSLRKPLRILIWGIGVGMCLYGGLGLVSDILHVTGVINDPATRKWFFIYLVLWDPWWVLGGALYVATAWLTRRRDDAA